MKGMKRIDFRSAMGCTMYLRNFPATPAPNTFSKALLYKWEAYCRTNGRRTAKQMGGVLLGFPFFKASKPGRHSDRNGGRTAVQIGDVLQYFLLDQ